MQLDWKDLHINSLCRCHPETPAALLPIGLSMWDCFGVAIALVAASCAERGKCDTLTQWRRLRILQAAGNRIAAGHNSWLDMTQTLKYVIQK